MCFVSNHLSYWLKSDFSTQVWWLFWFDDRFNFARPRQQFFIRSFFLSIMGSESGVVSYENWLYINITRSNVNELTNESDNVMMHANEKIYDTYKLLCSEATWCTWTSLNPCNLNYMNRKLGGKFSEYLKISFAVRKESIKHTSFWLKFSTNQFGSYWRPVASKPTKNIEKLCNNVIKCVGKAMCNSMSNTPADFRNWNYYYYYFLSFNQS